MIWTMMKSSFEMNRYFIFFIIFSNNKIVRKINQILKTIKLDELSTMETSVLNPIADTINRPAPSFLLDAIKLFQRNDFESGVKTVRDAIKETTQADVWEKHWPRVSYFFGLG